MNELEQKLLLQIVEQLVKGQTWEHPQFTRESLQAIARIRKAMSDRKNFEETH